MIDKLSNKKIERIAVEAVISETNNPNSCLVANIPVNDKGISFDGDIEVFKDNSETVESMLGRVPVQVKGKQVNDFSNGVIKYSIGLDHISNYYDSNGVLYFVVEVLVTGDYKIFYKQLLPKELREIIKKYKEEKGQEERVIELRPLNETRIDRVCNLFLQESKKQPPHLIDNNPFQDENFTSFQLSSLTFNPANINTQNIFEHDFTLYGKIKSLSIPLENVRIHAYSSFMLETIIIDEKKYIVNIKATREPEKFTVMVEDSLEIKFLIGKNKYDFKLIKFNSLSVQLDVIELFLGLLEGKNISFEQLSISYSNHDTRSNKNKALIANLLELNHYLKKFSEILTNYGIKEDFMVQSDSQEINETVDVIYSFVNMITKNNYSKLSLASPDSAKFTKISIGNINFILFYNPGRLDKLINPFGSKFLLNKAWIKVEGIYHEISPYVMLPAHALAFGSNVQIDLIIQSFELYDPFYNEAVAGLTNEFCLNCILAYDLCGDNRLLQLAQRVYDKYTGTSLNDNVVFINSVQIQLRLNNTLSQDRILKLIEMKNNKDNELLYCINVLLQNKIESDFYYKQMTEEQQTYYATLPIYSIYTKLVN